MMDIATIQAALVGYQAKHDEITAKMAEIRKELGGKPARTAVAPKTEAAHRKKRRMSAAGRKAISEATKKRWAEWKKTKK